MTIRRNGVWGVVLVVLLSGVYVFSVGLAERAEFHQSRFAEYRWLHAPVDYLGEQDLLQESYYRYLATWTGETPEEISSRKEPWWSNHVMSPRAREIERNLGIR